VESVVSIFMKNDILSMHRQEKSEREISRELGISRTTVRKYIKQSKLLMKEIEQTKDPSMIASLQGELVSKPKRKSVQIRKVFTGELERRFYELITLDEQKNLKLGVNKQNLNAALLHRTLLKEGFKVGITTIQLAFNDYKNKNKEAYIKQEHKPGIRAEYDFHEVKILERGLRKKRYQATISLPHSGYVYVRHYENQKMENFIDSLVNFFETIEGVPQKLVFDNMRNVVRSFVYGGGKTYTEDLIKLSNYYGFKIVTTNPRSGHEKGHVEQSGKVIRTELFTFQYEFDSLNEMRIYSKERMDELNFAVMDKFINEQNHFLKLPVVRYELGRIQQSRVNHESLISIDSNYYSVPEQYVGKTVIANVYPDHINIYNEKHEHIAKHTKKAAKAGYAINIHHFISTFLRKPGALINSTALDQAPKIYQELFHKYFTTKPKEYINLIKDKNIYEITEILTNLNQGQNKARQKQQVETIETMSLNQLNQIANIFNQEHSTNE
jgi:transposase